MSRLVAALSRADAQPLPATTLPDRAAIRRHFAPSQASVTRRALLIAITAAAISVGGAWQALPSFSPAHGGAPFVHSAAAATLSPAGDPLPAPELPAEAAADLASLTPGGHGTPAESMASVLPPELVAQPAKPPRPSAGRSPAPKPAAQPAAVVAPASGGAAGSEVRLKRGGNAAHLDPALTRAFAAWQEGRNEDARRDYEELLKREPHSLDALLGLAALAVARGEGAQAEALYLRAFALNPADAEVQAGLINLRGEGDPLQAESRLKNLLARQPEVASLHVALGNLLARQARWAEAREAYFRAATLVPGNGDLLHNLAVSLDHLRQYPLAVEHYRMALAAAARGRASFDTAMVERRLAELEP